jgi:hypothetical protein
MGEFDAGAAVCWGRRLGDPMKWYFLLCFLAAVIATILWLPVIAFAIVTHKLTIRNFLGLAGPAPFFIWGAREMYQAYRGSN